MYVGNYIHLSDIFLKLFLCSILCIYICRKLIYIYIGPIGATSRVPHCKGVQSGQSADQMNSDEFARIA